MQTTEIIDALRPLSKHERKAFSRMMRKANANALHVIDPAKEKHLKLVLLAKSRHAPDWRVLSRLSDINFDLQEGRISPQEAQSRAEFKLARWLDQNMYEDVKIFWRYGKPIMDRRTDAAFAKATPKQRQRTVAENKFYADLDNLF